MAEPARPGIQVVDASPFFRRTIVETLARAGWSCRAAPDLAAAGDELASAAVMVLDLETAGAPGIDAIRRLRGERPAPRVLVLGGPACHARALAALRAGACGQLAKPLHEEELCLAVERAVDGWRADLAREAPQAADGAAAVGPDAVGPEADADLALELCEAVVGEGDPAALPVTLLARLAERLGATGAALYLAEPGEGSFRREAVWEAGPVVDRAWLPAGRGLSGAAAATGVFVACAEPADDPRFDPAVDRPEEGAAGGLLCLPLRFRRNTVGLVRAHLPPGRAPSLRTAEIAGAALSAALRSVLLYRSWRSSIDEVARIRRESAARPGAPGWATPRSPRPRE